jgi:acetylornithine deacetylase/succinyl-diaminopimelate desuccinylase-like protein
MQSDPRVQDWLKANHSRLVRDLADLVAIQSISTDGQHATQINESADLTCKQMKQAGLQNVRILKTKDSYPYVYGDWLNAPGKPTLFLYAHHDVQPVNEPDQWLSKPWELTARDGRLYGRGSADDKGAITAHLGSIEAYLKTVGSLPVNIKMLVEGEEEVGSKNLLGFFQENKDLIQADVIVVLDTENIEVGLPSITYSLRGIVAVEVEVRSAKIPVHSGMAGGALADSAIALNQILGRLYWGNGKIPIPGFYDQVRALTPAEKAEIAQLPAEEAAWRENYGILPGVSFALEKGLSICEQTWRFPSVTVIAQQASSLASASNQVLPTAKAIVSCRIVPDMDPEVVYQNLKTFLTANPPWGVEVSVKPSGPAVNWWMTDPTGPAFEAARGAMETAWGKKAVAIGCGGTIGFVGPLADLLGGAPALLLGIEDPLTNAHAPNESLHEGDWKNLMTALTHLYARLGSLPGGKVR